MAQTSLLTGLRLGEVSALQWEDVDYENGLIRVSRARDASGVSVTPKTKAGMRFVPIGPRTVSFLQSYQESQSQIREAQRRALLPIAAHAGQPDKRPGIHRCTKPNSVRVQKALRALRELLRAERSGFLFPVSPQDPAILEANRSKRAKARGLPSPPTIERLPVIESRRLQKAFHAAARAEGVEMRFHDLRHTFASVLLHNAGNAALAQLAQCLGHSSIAFSMKQYMHVLNSRSQEFIAAVDALAPGPQPSNSPSTRPRVVLVGGSNADDRS